MVTLAWQKQQVSKALYIFRKCGESRLPIANSMMEIRGMDEWQARNDITFVPSPRHAESRANNFGRRWIFDKWKDTRELESIRKVNAESHSSHSPRVAFGGIEINDANLQF